MYAGEPEAQWSVGLIAKRQNGNGVEVMRRLIVSSGAAGRVMDLRWIYKAGVWYDRRLICDFAERGP